VRQEYWRKSFLLHLCGASIFLFAFQAMGKGWFYSAFSGASINIFFLYMRFAARAAGVLSKILLHLFCLGFALGIRKTQFNSLSCSMLERRSARSKNC
jgi:hypothetical protein